MISPTPTTPGFRGRGFVLILGLFLAACGAGQKHSTATTPATTPTTPATPARGSSKLAEYLLREGEGGFEVFSVAVDQPTVAFWMKSSQSTSADGRRVQSEGFRDALEQRTATPTGGTGLDFVLELGSPAAARAEQAVELGEDISEQGHVPVSRFTLAGVPGADGIAASKGKQGSAANVLFTVGRCLLLVGDGGVDPRYRADVAAGARALYRRTITGTGACTPRGALQV